MVREGQVNTSRVDIELTPEHMAETDTEMTTVHTEPEENGYSF